MRPEKGGIGEVRVRCSATRPSTTIMTTSYGRIISRLLVEIRDHNCDLISKEGKIDGRARLRVTMGEGDRFDLTIVNHNRDLISKEGKIDGRARLRVTMGDGGPDRSSCRES